MAFIDNLRSTFRREGAPVTMGIVAALVVVSVISALTQNRLAESLAFFTAAPQNLWTWLTYPYVFPLTGFGIVFLLFLVIWLIWTAGSTERDLGSSKFAAVWAVFTVLPALCVLIGARLLGFNAPILGPLLPVAASTVIWGFRNKTQTILLFGIIPLTGYWLALLTVGIVLINYWQIHPLMGVFACIPLLAAYAFAADMIPGVRYAGAPVEKYKPSRGQKIREETFFDDVRKREQQRADRERLRKMFEESVDDKEDKS